jgi:hypothetical protein
MPRVTVDGMDGFEADLDDLLKDNRSGSSGTDFDIPDFLR